MTGSTDPSLAKVHQFSDGPLEQRLPVLAELPRQYAGVETCLDDARKQSVRRPGALWFPAMFSSQNSESAWREGMA